MREILIFVLVFYAGAIFGFFTHRWVVSKTSYSGTMYVSHDAEKTLYSLELNEYPESIEFKKEIVFKVDASEKSLDIDRE
jgi:hypothetical protein